MERLKELSLFSGSFDLNQLNAVHQWIQRFGWDKEDEDRIKILIDTIHEHKREVAEALSTTMTRPTPTRLKKEELQAEVKKVLPTKIDLEIRQEEAKMPVVGFCPKCGSVMGGLPTPTCAKKDFDRVFYKECTACPYFSEIFRRRNKYYEVEEGD